MRLFGDVPAADPLIGDCPAKPEAENPAELAATIARLFALEAEALARRREEARQYAEDYLHAPTDARREAMIREILAPEGRT